MRLHLASVLLFAVAGVCRAQLVVPPSLDALGFLRGVWVSEDAGRGGTTEFHWSVMDGQMVLAARHWNNQIQSCPACDLQSAMVAYVDRPSNQVYARFEDKELGASLLKLMLTGDKSAEFVEVNGHSAPAHRLRYRLTPGDVLLVTLERSSLKAIREFSIVQRWTLHRQALVAPVSVRD